MQYKTDIQSFIQAEISISKLLSPRSLAPKSYHHHHQRLHWRTRHPQTRCYCYVLRLQRRRLGGSIRPSSQMADFNPLASLSEIAAELPRQPTPATAAVKAAAATTNGVTKQRRLSSAGQSRRRHSDATAATLTNVVVSRISYAPSSSSYSYSPYTEARVCSLSMYAFVPPYLTLDAWSDGRVRPSIPIIFPCSDISPTKFMDLFLRALSCKQLL